MKMGIDKKKFQLEPLESRLLLSANGILDTVAVPSSIVGADVVVEVLGAGEQITAANHVGSMYAPEGNLPDLLAANSPALTSAAPAAVAMTPVDGVSPAPAETGTTSVVVQAEAAGQTLTGSVTESPAGPSAFQAPDQQTKTDELVATLHGSEPPPVGVQNIHLVAAQPVTAPSGLVINSGDTLSGNGAITGNLLNLGTLSPGNSPGIVNITGDTVLDPSGSLLVEIGGLTPGPGSPNINDGYDQVNVSGAATLGGTLQISLLDGYLPQVGDSFTIMTYGSATGAFNSVNGLVIGDGLVFKLEQGATELRLVVSNDIMDVIDAVFSGHAGSFTQTVTPGDIQLGGVLGIQSPSLTFNFAYSSGSWSGSISLTASGASFQIGDAVSATIADTNSDGIALTGTYSLSIGSPLSGTFSLTADKFSLSIPSLLTADATGVTLGYNPNGLPEQELVNLDHLSVAILPLDDTIVTVNNLSIRANGFSLTDAEVTKSSVTLGSVVSIQTLTLTFKDVKYSTTGGLQGTFGVSAATVSMFPGYDAFTSTITGFSGSYTLGTRALSLGAATVAFEIGNLLKLTATDVGFDLDPFKVTIGGIEVSSPRFQAFNLTASATGLTITSTGFSVASATLSTTSSVSIGPVLTVSGLSITATDFGYEVGSGAKFNGTLSVTVGSAALFPTKPVNASATNIVVTVNLAHEHEGELSFSAATVSFTLGSIFEASASSVSINPTPGPGQLAFSFARITAGLPQFGISGTLGDTGTDPSPPASFGFDVNGKIQVLAGASFGFSFDTATADAAQSLKWPSWLPVQISELSIAWGNITENPADFVLTFSASVNLSQIKGAPLSLSGSVTDIVIDVGKLIALEFPIVSIGVVSVSVTGDLFGGTISATLVAGVFRYDSEGYEVDSSNQRVGLPDGTPTDPVGAISSAFYGGIKGGFSMKGLSGFELSIGLSEFGPLSVYVTVSLPTGILLEPNSGLTINNLRGGVDFNMTLPNIPNPDTGTAVDALQLRRDEFNSPEGMTEVQWKASLRRAVGQQIVTIIAARSQGLPDPNFWNVFAYPMIIRAGADLYSQYTSDNVFKAKIDLALDTQGRILISGEAVFANSLSLGLRLYANLSPVIDGSVNKGAKVTILFLSDFPSGAGVTPIFSVYGRADFFFSRTDGTPVTATNKADQFEIFLAGAATMNVLDQFSVTYSGSLGLAFSTTGFVMKVNAQANVSYLGNIGTAAGELHVQKVSGSSLEIWGAFLMTADLSAMEQSGIYASGLVFFALNTTSAAKSVTLTLPATPPATPTAYPLDLKPTSFGLLIDGKAVIKLPKSSPSDPGLFSMTAVLVVDIDTSGLRIFAEGSMTLGSPGVDPLLSFSFNGLLVTNSQGIAARLTLIYTNNAIPGVGLNARFHLVLNTTGLAVQYQIPTLPTGDQIPFVTGPNPADPTGPEILLEGPGRTISIPGGPPVLGDGIANWVPTAENAGKPYAVIFGGGSLSLLGTFTLDGALLLILSPAELAMSVDMSLSLADLGTVNATGTLLIDSSGVAGALSIGVQAGVFKSGPQFSLSGVAFFMVNTRASPVPALHLPAGPYAQVGITGTLILGLASGTSFTMVGNFVLTTTATETAVSASSTLTAELGGVTLFSMQADGALVMSANGIAARIVLGSGGSSGLSGDGFTFTGYFTLEVNTTTQAVAEINAVTVNLAPGPYVRVRIGGDPAVSGSTATLALSEAGDNSIGMNGRFDLEMSPAGLAVTASATLFMKLGGATLFSLNANGALLVTADGIAAKLSLGTGQLEHCCRQRLLVRRVFHPRAEHRHPAGYEDQRRRREP